MERMKNKLCKGCGEPLYGDKCPKRFHSWMETKHGNYHVKCFILEPSLTTDATMAGLLEYATEDGKELKP
jgi:hypothetical protein